MSTNVPNLKQIGGGHRKTLVDLTWNDPMVKNKINKALSAGWGAKMTTKCLSASALAGVRWSRGNLYRKSPRTSLYCPDIAGVRWSQSPLKTGTTVKWINMTKRLTYLFNSCSSVTFDVGFPRLEPFNNWEKFSARGASLTPFTRSWRETLSTNTVSVVMTTTAPVAPPGGVDVSLGSLGWEPRRDCRESTKTSYSVRVGWVSVETNITFMLRAVKINMKIQIFVW